MIRLNTPIESLVINLQSAGNVQYNIQYVIVRQGTRLEKSTEGLLTSSGQNVVLINDFSSGYFDITYINVTNIDPTENFISVLKKTNVSEFNLTSEAIGLKNRECTEFTSESGFKVLDQNGSFKTITESVSADGDVQNSDMTYMASVPSGGTLTLPDSQINVNGVDEGDVVSVKTIDVNLTDGVDLVVPTSVGLVANTLTITLPASGGGDVDVEINGNPYDTVTAPDTVDIPVVNTLPTPVGTIVGTDVVVGNSTVNVRDTAANLLHAVSVRAEATTTQDIADTTVENSDATYSVDVLAEGSLILPDSQINVNGVNEGDVVSVKTIDVNLEDSLGDPVTPTSVVLVDNTLTIEVPSGATPMDVDFSADKLTALIGENITFTDLSDQSPTHWSWRFNDGTTSIVQNPVKFFTTLGLKNVTLLAGKVGAGGVNIKNSYIEITGDADAEAFFARVIAAGGTLTSNERAATTSLVLQLKADNIWNSMVAIYPMVGASAAACSQNLKSSNFTGSFSSGWTFASTGITGNGTNTFFNTTIVPLTNLLQNNTHLSFYSRTNNTQSGVDMGSVNLTIQYFGGTLFYRINSSNYANLGSQSSLGFTLASRIISTEQKLYKNSSLINTNTQGTNTQDSTNIYLGAWSSIPNYPTNREYAFASIGDGLTDTQASNFYSAVQAFQTTLGRQV
jgi:PKD repeat protein